MEEERLLKKIENERKKAEQLQKVRDSYDQQHKQLRQASLEREQQQIEYYELNQNKKSLTKMFISERSNQILKSKKELHDEVINQKIQLQKDKERFHESVNYQKQVNAMMIKEQLQRSRQKLEEMERIKEEQRKRSYIERIKQERKSKRSAEKQRKNLSKIENELQERVMKTKEMYQSLKPFNESSLDSSLNGGSIRYQAKQNL